MNKVNYYLKSIEEIQRNKSLGINPSILLHACCGPCATYPLLFLVENGFNVTIYFNNSNIYPRSEYDRRLEELKRFVDEFNKEYQQSIKVIVESYDNDLYNLDLDQYENEDEGYNRCKLCFKKRLKQGYLYAENNNFDYFTTVMTISRQKDAQYLNALGKELENGMKICKYFVSDFKKNRGIDIARDMRIKYNLYQQTYCGCKYTYNKKKDI